jgi:hypothetical protein
MYENLIAKLKEYNQRESTYSQHSFLEHFSDSESQGALKDFLRRYSHKPMNFFHASDDWQAFVPAAFQSTIAEYGAIDPLPDGLITPQSESRDHAVKRFVWKSTPIEDYLEGEPFNESYIEGGTAVVRWRKPGSKIMQSYEASSDLPLDVLQTTLRLTLNEFRVREWKHFTHELHKSTSDQFDTRSTDKNGQPLVINGWKDLFDNAYPDVGVDALGAIAWSDVKEARQKMLRRQRDAVRPNILLINATTEAALSEDEKVVNAHIFGGPDTHFRTGTLPNVYGLQVIVVSDANFGYFTDDISRKNDEFNQSTDGFLITTNNGPTILRHNREPMSTETWNVFDGQKRAMNIWERYDFGTFRYTNIMRIRTVNGSVELL